MPPKKSSKNIFENFNQVRDDKTGKVSYSDADATQNDQQFDKY